MLPAGAQEKISFRSADGVTVDAYLERPDTTKPAPALVFMHGCGGLFTAKGAIDTRETDWARRFTAAGYAVLMVDSFTARGVKQMCAPATFRAEVYDARPGDAYAALAYLRTQTFIAGDRIGLMGWSEGGGAVLFAMSGSGRSTDVAQGFRAAVALYPARCSLRRLRSWKTDAPVMILIGSGDVWTPAGPCEQAVTQAQARGVPVQIRVYEGAYHDFDWPGMPKHEVPAYRTAAGVVPIEGMDPAARADALVRVPDFFRRYLGGGAQVGAPPNR